MSEKHYPYYGGSFDRIIFDGDGSVWVPESESAKLCAERDEWHRVAVSKQDIIDHMRDAKAENAELREYGKLLHDHIKECCDYCGECGTCDVDALTRELGIEVQS